MLLRVDRWNTKLKGNGMNISINSIGAGVKTFCTGEQAAVAGKKTEDAKDGNEGLKVSDVRNIDVLVGSEPVADVPAGEMVRDDGLGRLVSSAFNLPPPPMPDFLA